MPKGRKNQHKHNASTQLAVGGVDVIGVAGGNAVVVVNQHRPITQIIGTIVTITTMVTIAA
ncbi:unnamed protein product [Prunus armeniaca]